MAFCLQPWFRWETQSLWDADAQGADHRSVRGIRTHPSSPH